MKRSFIREILEIIDSNTISFAGGLPNEDLFPIEALEQSSSRVFSKKNNLQYMKSIGSDDLREKIASFYDFETTKENILITQGAQQGLDLISRFFFEKEILIEAPSYLGAINIFKLNKMEIDTAKLLSDGVDLSEFEAKFRNLTYLNPDFQNPSTICYSQTKREQIGEIISKKGGYLIEDGAYKELFFEAKNRTISSYLPQNSFHLGSFSKVLAPNLRIGWVRADEKLISKLLSIKEAMDLQSCGISQYIIADFLEHNSFENHLKIIRDDYEDRCSFFVKELRKNLPNFQFDNPKGGMFIYGELKNSDTKELAQKALKNSVAFVPSCEFYIDRADNSSIRFNFTNSSKTQIREGIERISQII